jgi:hypothetical protein
MIALERFAIGLAIVGALILVLALVQGLGESVGHGIVERLVR